MREIGLHGYYAGRRTIVLAQHTEFTSIVAVSEQQGHNHKVSRSGQIQIQIQNNLLWVLFVLLLMLLLLLFRD